MPQPIVRFTLKGLSHDGFTILLGTPKTNYVCGVVDYM